MQLEIIPFQARNIALNAFVTTTFKMEGLWRLRRTATCLAVEIAQSSAVPETGLQSGLLELQSLIRHLLPVREILLTNKLSKVEYT